MNKQLQQLDKNLCKHIQRTDLPDFVRPMEASLVDAAFSDSNWIFERKLDGERCLIRKDGNHVALLSRNEKDKSTTYPEIVEAMQTVKENFLADAEIVTFDGTVTSFKRLQKRLHQTHPDDDLCKEVPVMAYLFDLIYLDGYNLQELQLRNRKKLLRETFTWQDPIHYLPHRNESGRAFFQTACAKGWEGLIAKHAASSYINGRSKKWLKFKCDHRQELVIGGYTEPEGERQGFGALLLGYYDEDAGLIYAGCVGTGFDHAFLQDFHHKLENIERRTSPFTNFDQERATHWVRPQYVCDVGFTEWTSNHRLRHPRFLGLRDDKSPRDVKRETCS